MMNRLLASLLLATALVTPAAFAQDANNPPADTAQQAPANSTPQVTGGAAGQNAGFFSAGKLTALGAVSGVAAAGALAAAIGGGDDESGPPTTSTSTSTSTATSTATATATR